MMISENRKVSYIANRSLSNTIGCLGKNRVYIRNKFDCDTVNCKLPVESIQNNDHISIRSVAERGISPAVDPLDSTSRIMDPNVIGAEHYGVARGVQKILQDYKSLQVGIDREHKSFGFFQDLIF